MCGFIIVNVCCMCEDIMLWYNRKMFCNDNFEYICLGIYKFELFGFFIWLYKKILNVILNYVNGEYIYILGIYLGYIEKFWFDKCWLYKISKFIFWMWGG